ncbi:MAG: response regulator [Anaeromyxobacter sp.]
MNGVDAATRARLVGLFVAEAKESLEVLRGLSARLREGEAGEALADFGRIAHGLKGAAASLEYRELARALHDLEALALGRLGDDPAAAAVRDGRITRALELIGAGLERMAAMLADAFPEDLLKPLLATVAAPPVGAGPGEQRAGAAPGAAPAAPAPRPTSQPPAARAAEKRPARAPEGEERLSVPAGDVDEALRLAASVSRALAHLHEARVEDPALQGLATASAALEGLIASLRLVRADHALGGLEAEIEALAARLGKQVVPVIVAGEVRADRRTLETARGLMRHLLRNALDHGIEPPEARRAAGKPAAGRVAVRLSTAESALQVEVADDGAGFDVVAIRAQLARRGGDAAAAEALPDEEVLQRWAFEGGSTRAEATDVSGRGLGLSAVAQLARETGGAIQIRSVRGLGATVTFSLPLEVYAVEALSITAGGRTFGLPIGTVERTVLLAAAGTAVHDGPAGRTLAVDETILPLVPLSEALGLPARPGRERFALVVRAEGSMAAVAVEDVGAVTGMVPAAVPGVAQADALVTGIARLADGTPVALLHPRLLLARARARPVAAPPAQAGAVAPAAAARRALEVVLAEDSLATREVLRVLLEQQGFRVRLAADGEEALQRIDEGLPDVVVSDVNMPRRDGLSLTRALRARAGTERLPVVLLTSQDDDATRSAGAAAGADAYLIKSRFNAGVLSETLARLGVRAP